MGAHPNPDKQEPKQENFITKAPQYDSSYLRGRRKYEDTNFRTKGQNDQV